MEGGFSPLPHPVTLFSVLSLSESLSVQSAAPHAADWTDKALLFL